MMLPSTPVPILLSLVLLCGCVSLDAHPGAPATSAPASVVQPSASLDGEDYYLILHCGVEYASFFGLNWRALEPIPTFPATVTDPSTGYAKKLFGIQGRVLRTSPTSARFTTTEPPIGLVVLFERTDVSPTPCL
jgi:hypothetical protein